MGRNADGHPCRPEGFDLVQVVRDRRLAHPLETTPFVGDVKQHDLDARLRRSLGRGERLGDPEIMELADGREPGSTHLFIHQRIVRPHRRGCRPVRLLEHLVSPGPEVGSGGTSAQRSLKRVAVAVDESGDRETSAHAFPTLALRDRQTSGRAEPLLFRNGHRHRLRSAATDPECPHAPSVRRDSRLHLAVARRARRAELAGRHRLRPRRRSRINWMAIWRGAGTSSRSSGRSQTHSPTG